MTAARPRTPSWARALLAPDTALLAAARQNAYDALVTTRRRAAYRREAEEALRSAEARRQAARTIVRSS